MSHQINLDNSPTKHETPKLIGRIDCDADYRDRLDKEIDFAKKALKNV